MTEGQASACADQFVDEARRNPVVPPAIINLGTYTNFRTNLTEAFSAYDTPGDALDQMKTMRMKNDDSIDEHIAKFKTLLAEARLDEKSAVVIDLFRETLTVPIQRRILTLESPPTTLKDWYTWATKIDHNWRKMQRVIGRTNQTNNKGKNTQKKFYFPRKERDPNAMDVDTLSIEERTKLMKEGRCFTCKMTGHLCKDCPRKQKKTEEPPKKITGNELHTQVRA